MRLTTSAPSEMSPEKLLDLKLELLDGLPEHYRAMEVRLPAGRFLRLENVGTELERAFRRR